MSNSTHSVSAQDYAFSFQAEIDAYDKLPVPLREKIAYCNVTVSSKTVLSLWHVCRDISMCEKAIDQMAEMLQKDIVK